MPNKKIKTILFDLGETLLTFGKLNTFHLFSQGARSSYDFLKSLGQPVGGFNWYFIHCLLSLRTHRLISRLTGNDFNALEIFQKVAAKKGVESSIAET